MVVNFPNDKIDDRLSITDDSSNTSFEMGHSSMEYSSSSGSEFRKARREFSMRPRRDADNQSMKFLENFDPDRSNREKRKMNQKIEVGLGSVGIGIAGGRLYDDRGVHIATGLDMCDCLNEHCPGCHFPCPRCRSNKCGHECRVNRKWTVESIEVHCKRLEKKNQLLKMSGRLP